MLKNQENAKSRSDKGYHAVPLPYTGNYRPPKPNLMFIDEQVESESVDVVFNVASSDVKTVESKHESVNVNNNSVYNTVETKPIRKNNFSPPIIKDWNFDDESEVEFKPKVEVKTVRPSIEKIQFVKTVREKVEKGNPQQKEYKEKEVIDSGIACLPNDAIFKGLARTGVLSLEQTKTNQATKIEKLKKRVKKLKGKKKKRTHGLKRLYKGRIAEIDANEDLFLIDETAQDQERIKDQDLFGVHDLDGDEVFVDVTTAENVEQDATVAKSVQVAKPKAKGVTIQEPSEFRTISPLQPSQPPQAKDKGKGIMVEHEKPLKKKDQIALDEEVERKLEVEIKAKMEEEERIAREKNEANREIIKE
nr:hypothetical protein [Tanacetum cinerariifolium]